MAMAPYQVTNIVFNKDDRFRFGSRKQHAVNNMLFFESAVKMENRVLNLPKSVQDRPHEWNHEAMIQGSKAAEERRRMPRGMTARPDPVVRNKIAALERTLQMEQRRRKLLAPHYDEFLRLFDGVNAGSMHDDFEPIPLSTTAKARRAKVEERKQLREARLRELKSQYGSGGKRRGTKQQQAAQAAAARKRGPNITAIQAQILRAQGKPVPLKGVMAQTASRGLLE